MPSVEEFYAREFALPRLEQRYGAEFGRVKFHRAEIMYEGFGIVRLRPDGELAQMGVRERDVLPDNSAWTVYSALRAGEQGQSATFEVINADEWNAGHDQTFRTIQIPARASGR